MLTATADLLNTTQAAAYLGKSPITLATWRCSRRYPLPYVRNGGTIRYRKTDLDAFLERRTVRIKDRELQGA